VIACGLLRNSDVRVSQVKSILRDIVEAFVHVKISIDVAPLQIERLEANPRTIRRR